MKTNKIVKYLVDEYGWTEKFTDMQLKLIKDVASIVIDKSGAVVSTKDDTVVKK